jgi:hypothetical protein
VVIEDCETQHRAWSHSVGLEVDAQYVEAARAHPDGGFATTTVGSLMEKGTTTNADGYTRTRPPYTTTVFLAPSSLHATPDLVPNNHFHSHSMPYCFVCTFIN